MPSRTHLGLPSGCSAWPHRPPVGLEAFFLEVGGLVDSRTAPPPKLTPEEIGERQKKAASLSAKYHIEIVHA
jgi:hypothetical protein